MERQRILLPVRALILATLLVSSIAVAQDGEPQSPAASAETLGTGFTYQGQLVENGSPVNDDCDMAFRLYDEATGGVQVGATITTTVPITDGLFTVTLDFGAAAFDGDRRWLGIAVDCEEDGSYADLGRQELTAAPHALYAMSAPWSGLTDVPAGFADGIDNGATYQNVVVVAKSGGDYASVQSAIESITDAAEDNAYLVWVAPGVYSETVTMKPYVHLQGAGQEATVISSTVSSTWPYIYATLTLTQSTSLRDLTIFNGGTGSYNVALAAKHGTTRTLVADVTAQVQGGGIDNFTIFVIGSGTSVTLQHVTALAEGGSNGNFGLHNREGAAVTLHGGTFIGRGGTYARGIVNYDSATLEATSVTARGKNGDNSTGLFTYGSVAILHGGSFTGHGGTNAYGIYNGSSGATLEAQGVIALGENGSNYNFGLYNESGAATVLYGGSLTGRGGTYAWGIYNTGSGTTLEATGINVLGENGSVYNRGLYNLDLATAKINSSRLAGSLGAACVEGGTVYLGVTQLDGGAYRHVVAALTCFQVYDGNYILYNCP